MSDAPRYEPVIGLEIHAQLATKSKLFCACPNDSGGAPNSRTCPVCLGFPGTLPYPNEAAIERGVRMAIACGCRIAEESEFARKNYFYPDLPKGYQITQFDRPFAERGAVRIEVGGEVRAIRLRRIHFEEDAGKTMHDSPWPDVPPDVSLVDFNRAGVPLVEIVTEPDLRSADEADAFVSAIRRLLLYTGASRANMEEGNLRCDANVSVRPAGELELGTRVELKNLNSLRFLRQAIRHEIERQVAILDGGGTVDQETRLWDVERQRSAVMRTKEEAEDYRYFPDPDLPPLRLPRERVLEIAATLPELPDRRIDRWTSQWGIAPSDADLIADDPARADRFDAVATASTTLPELVERKADLPATMQVAARLETGPVAELEKDRHPGEPPVVGAALLADVAALVAAGTVTFGIGKKLLVDASASGESPRVLIAREGLGAVRDAQALAEIVARVVAGAPAQAAQWRAGKESVLGWFVGQAMRETKGAADAALLRELLAKELGPAGEP